MEEIKSAISMAVIANKVTGIGMDFFINRLCTIYGTEVVAVCLVELGIDNI